MQSRAYWLQVLLSGEMPVEIAVAELHKFPWDSEEALAILTPHHLANLLMRYLGEEITTNDIEAWANAIEGREDIAYQSGEEEKLAEAIHLLANPLLTKALTPAVAERLLQMLA